jgi:hypothetical protein
MQPSDIESSLDRRAATSFDEIRSGCVLFRDGFHESSAAVNQAGTVIGGKRRWENSGTNQSMQQRPTLGLGVMVHTVGIRQESQPVGDAVNSNRVR